MTPADHIRAALSPMDAAGASPGLCQRARLLWRDVAAWTDRDSPRRDGRARGAEDDDSEEVTS